MLPTAFPACAALCASGAAARDVQQAVIDAALIAAVNQDWEGMEGRLQQALEDAAAEGSAAANG